MALCGIECIELTTRGINNLGLNFFYNKQVENVENFAKHIINMEKVFNFWPMANPTIQGKITIPKTLALS